MELDPILLRGAPNCNTKKQATPCYASISL